MKVEITDKASPDFPMYHQIMDNGWVKECIYDGDLGCSLCICRTFCLCVEQLTRR